MDITENPKYKIFFDKLFEEYTYEKDFFIKNDEVFILNSTIKLNFDGKYNSIEFPNIKHTDGDFGKYNPDFSFKIYEANCDKLIFNKLETEFFSIENSYFNQLIFNNVDDSYIKTFDYQAKNEDPETEIIIPQNMNIEHIHICNSNHKWSILDNDSILSINLNNIRYKQINKYKNVISFTIKSVDLDDLNISESKKLTWFEYEQKDSRKKNIVVKNLNLCVLYLNLKNANLELENLSSLEILKIENNLSLTTDSNLLSQKVINLNNINSNNLKQLIIKGYKLDNSKILYSNTLFKLNVNKDCHPDVLETKTTLSLLGSNNLNLFVKVSDSNIYYTIDDVILKSRVNPELFNVINDLLEIRKSTPLMKKILLNDLDNITENDFKSIYQKDIAGFNVLFYCRTLDSLKVILKHKEYIFNKNDINLLSSEALRSYYQKEMILKDVNNSELNLITLKNNIKIKCL